MFFLSHAFKSISAEINRSFEDALKGMTDLDDITTDSISTKADPANEDVISISTGNHVPPTKEDIKLIGGDVFQFPNEKTTGDILIGGDYDEISEAQPRFYEESFNRRKDNEGSSYFEANVKSWQTDYITKTYYGGNSISANKSIYSKFKDIEPDHSKKDVRQWVDVKAEWNQWGGVSTAHVQLPPGWGVAGEHQGYTILMGPKGENLYIGESYENDFVQFTSKSIF